MRRTLSSAILVTVLTGWLAACAVQPQPVVTETASRAAREAVAEGRPVSYQSTDGWPRLDAYPQSGWGYS